MQGELLQAFRKRTRIDIQALSFCDIIALNRAPVSNLCAQELTAKLNNLSFLLKARVLLLQQGHKLGDIPLPTQA